jgi:hypothetical protein
MVSSRQELFRRRRSDETIKICANDFKGLLLSFSGRAAVIGCLGSVPMA